jgi:transposase
MRGDLKIRKIKTGSGAVAVQVVHYAGKRCDKIIHIGSAHNEASLAVLLEEANRYVETHCRQPSLFSSHRSAPLTAAAPESVSSMSLLRVTHGFAREVLHHCAHLCGLHRIPDVYLDLALMRIVEPASKLRTLELLQRYFGIHYVERTLYRSLPRLLKYQEAIEQAAINTATALLSDSLTLILYDVTTLYFESFHEYDFQQPGFSKDNKPQQPQIVIGLLTTSAGFPLMHTVFEGNTFEGHTMLEVVRRFQTRCNQAKPIIVADAAMLSRTNMKQLVDEGYRYIVGARLANMPATLIEQIDTHLPRDDKAIIRLSTTTDESYPAATVCEFSQARYNKDKREFDKQVARANTLIDKKEPGKRAKFVKKSNSNDTPFTFDDVLKTKTEKLLGIKGFVTNVPETEMSNDNIIACYRELWHVEHAFRMSKSDLKARPIYHHTQESIRAHLLICFMALMMGKYSEIKTGLSLRKIRDELWQVQEAHLRNTLTGDLHTFRTDISPTMHTILSKIVDLPH